VLDSPCTARLIAMTFGRLDLPGRYDGVLNLLRVVVAHLMRSSRACAYQMASGGVIVQDAVRYLAGGE